VGALLAGALVLALTSSLPGTGGTPRAAGQDLPREPFPYTDDSVPASDVTMIGATPDEAGAPGSYETWGIGRSASEPILVRYAAGSGWILGPGLQEHGGQPLSGFVLDTPEAFTSHAGPSTLAGQMTEHGAGVLAGSVDEGKQQVLLVREPNNPANPFRETEPLPAGELEHGERLFGLARAPLVAPLEESGHVGALVVPVKEREGGSYVEEYVLHWNGQKEEWTSEEIEIPSSVNASEFRVLGIGASSPANAWLLGQVSSEDVVLFRRQASGGEEVWKPVALKQDGVAGEPLSVSLNGGTEDEPISIPGAERERVQTQVLTVTSEGVWIDGERPQVHASTTIYFKPEGEEGGSRTSWCTLERSPPETKPCERTLPEALPTGPSRSIAWANPSTKFGERVIAGLPNGVSLRLEENGTFTRVLGLGGAGGRDQGATYGAAFSNPREGWLGNFRLPVHLTTEEEPSLLQPWPVSFRHALVAVAPQPEAPVGSLSSEALAVGDLGEVARFKPGEGWLPESLFGLGGKPETPRLRAVAWPTPNRAYAVGDAPSSEESQMWLWRGETGLWEPDPAAPYNFRGNLLGVAFDPENPNIGYAVGESGVLLGYGKTWTQEAFPAEAPCSPREAKNVEESERCASWSDASFTSVAFAGSEAIVAYRVLPSKTIEAYEGGLIVNDGSGWHIDQDAHTVMGSNVPWAVAGLPDGGAAFGASSTVYEREGAGGPWHATATPFPGGLEPGSLTAFRENGALRVIATGTVPDTYSVEKEPEAPPGSPPTEIRAYPLGSDPEAGVVRQTATGWSDQEHDLNDAAEPEGNWSFYDEVYQPDPVAAVLVNEAGSQGWAVGGFVEPENNGGLLDTADVDRYPAESGTEPLGVAQSKIPLAPEKETATFAIAGNAQCAAPCAVRANTKIGPDVWLETALQRADIPGERKELSGVRAFLYTGPRLVNPEAITGPRETADKISYEEELARYTEILARSPIPAYVAGTDTDLDEAKAEGSFEGAFFFSTSPFSPKPFGGTPAEQGAIVPVGLRPLPCGETPGCQGAYYAFESRGEAGTRTVRVIMLDDSAETDPAQLAWLKEELISAKSAGQPAIVVGNADLNAEYGSREHPEAAEVERALAQHGAEASAYFFDSPEENISEPLRVESETPEPHIPTFGSGTIGYVKYQNETGGDFIGASGFLLGEVDFAKYDSSTNRALVTAQLIPSIGELALEGKNGTLLRRSEAALFSGLARRSRSGNRSASGGNGAPETSPYIPIPATCIGLLCPESGGPGLLPKYEFVSSNAQIGGFVKQDLAAEPKGREPAFNAKGEPEKEPVVNGESISTKSALFCAYNAGTTTVTIRAGGLSASLPVTIQAGSVRQPCGTVPLSTVPSKPQSTPVPTPAPAPTPSGPAPASAPPPVPVPPLPLATPAPAPRPTPLPPFFVPSVPPVTVLAFVPLPVPTPARPTPPSGTSAVTSPVEAAEREEEKEAAPESVSNEAVAYRAPEHEPAPAYILGIILLAAFAGASVRRRPRRGRRELQIAPATTSTMRSQRRMSTLRGRRW
jgi:hypothetical protein